MNAFLEVFRKFLGIEHVSASFRDKLVSGGTALLGMMICFQICSWAVGQSNTPALIASMGASAVLLFAVPHGPLSQPWALAGGHVLSALVGVTFHKLWGGGWAVASSAVAVAILVMHFARCVHPPGGATALTAVIGGPVIERLGFGYVVTPVLLNVTVLMFGAILLNYLLPWRRYPAEFSQASKLGLEKNNTLPTFEKEDLEHALKKVGSLIDVSEKDLEEIYTLAEAHARARRATIVQFRPKVSSRLLSVTKTRRAG